MIAVVAVHVSLAIDRPRPALPPPLSTGRSLVHLTDTCTRPGLRDSCVGCCRILKYYLAELRREFLRGCAFSRYKQFETSPKTIEQELQPAVCEQRHL